jgi:hypothetical protein
MRRSHRNQSGTVRVELKYCEHCGGLWVREGGGGVYCGKCQPKVADLPNPKKKRAGRVVLPSGKRAVVDDFEIPVEGIGDLEAVGGVA